MFPTHTHEILSGVIDKMSELGSEPKERFFAIPCNASITRLSLSPNLLIWYSAIVFFDNIPSFFVSWCSSNASTLEREAILKILDTNLAPVARLIDVATINDSTASETRVLIEEYISPPTIDDIANNSSYARLNQSSPSDQTTLSHQTLKQLLEFLESIYATTKQQSSQQQLVAEIQSLVSVLTKHRLINHKRGLQIESTIVNFLNKSYLENNETPTKSLVIPALSLNQICKSSATSNGQHLRVKNGFKAVFSHFNIFNWLSLLEHSSSLKASSFSKLSLPKPFESLRSEDSENVNSNIASHQEIKLALFDLFRAFLITHQFEGFPSELISSIMSDDIKQLISQSSEYQDIESKYSQWSSFSFAEKLIGTFVNLTEFSSTYEEKYREAQNELAYLRVAYGTTQNELDTLKIKLTNLEAEIANYTKQIEDLNTNQANQPEIVTLKNQLAHRDEVLQSIIRSPGYKIGRATTSVIKAIPGSKRFGSIFK